MSTRMYMCEGLLIRNTCHKMSDGDLSQVGGFSLWSLTGMLMGRGFGKDNGGHRGTNNDTQY